MAWHQLKIEPCIFSYPSKISLKCDNYLNGCLMRYIVKAWLFIPVVSIMKKKYPYNQIIPINHLLAFGNCFKQSKVPQWDHSSFEVTLWCICQPLSYNRFWLGFGAILMTVVLLVNASLLHHCQTNNLSQMAPDCLYSALLFTRAREEKSVIWDVGTISVNSFLVNYVGSSRLVWQKPSLTEGERVISPVNHFSPRSRGGKHSEGWASWGPWV